jgi:hypothetical protein
MVLATFAETKVARLPGRNPAIQNITLKRGTEDKSVVESVVWRFGEAIRRQMVQEAGETDGDRISSTTILPPTLSPISESEIKSCFVGGCVANVRGER